jgi:hypothetical protein
LKKWLGIAATALVLIAVVFWLIHIGHDAPATTIVSVTGGALVVVYQIGRQAQNAIKQNRENEAIKLKLEVYKDIIGISREASDAIGDLSSFVREFHSTLSLAQQTQSEVGEFVVPSFHPSQLIEKKSKLASSNIRVMAITETWQIIDPRMDIFRTAIVSSLYDIDEAYPHYFNTAFSAMPIAFPKDAWTPPAADVLRGIALQGDILINTLMTLQSYIFDFLREMQTLLVGQMFDHAIPARAPIDPSSVVVRLDRHAELSSYFREQSNWGRNQAQIEAALRRRSGA